MAAVTLPPKTLADGNIRVTFLPTVADPKNVKLSELTGSNAVDLSCRVLKSDFRLSATDSETIDDQSALCEVTSPTVYGASNYEGTASIFRFFDKTNPGAADKAGDVAFQALKTKGTQGYIVKRETGKPYDAEYAAGDEIEVFQILTDTPQAPSDAGGWIRRTIPLGVQNAWLDGKVAAEG